MHNICHLNDLLLSPVCAGHVPGQLPGQDDDRLDPGHPRLGRHLLPPKDLQGQPGQDWWGAYASSVSWNQIITWNDFSTCSQIPDVYNYSEILSEKFFLPGRSMRSWPARCLQPSPPPSPARRRSRTSSTPRTRTSSTRRTRESSNRKLLLFFNWLTCSPSWDLCWQPLACLNPVHLPLDLNEIARNKLLGKLFYDKKNFFPFYNCLCEWSCRVQTYVKDGMKPTCGAQASWLILIRAYVPWLRTHGGYKNILKTNPWSFNLSVAV